MRCENVMTSQEMCFQAKGRGIIITKDKEIQEEEILKNKTYKQK